MNPSQRKQLYLASSSPRRAELLAQIGVDFEQLFVDVDEKRKNRESVTEYVARLAFEKATAGHQLALDKNIPVLGADTIVYIAGEILGKPQNLNEATRMLRLLSGQTHQVLTAVALVNASKQRQIVQSSSVTMRDISDNEIEAYWQTGEPHDKAGSYAIQGKAAIYISHIEGSYSGVMGLPVFETASLLKEYGI